MTGFHLTRARLGLTVTKFFLLAVRLNRIVARLLWIVNRIFLSRIRLNLVVVRFILMGIEIVPIQVSGVLLRELAGNLNPA
ncbi:MAG TPA: hypothetical protein VN493_20250 [Thermoanaerobaculia bacterium]|nr:hypothetical protein [Thermoanaerobaculia bacterium]